MTFAGRERLPGLAELGRLSRAETMSRGEWSEAFAVAVENETHVDVTSASITDWMEAADYPASARARIANELASADRAGRNRRIGELIWNAADRMAGGNARQRAAALRELTTGLGMREVIGAGVTTDVDELIRENQRQAIPGGEAGALVNAALDAGALTLDDVQGVVQLAELLHRHARHEGLDPSERSSMRRALDAWPDVLAHAVELLTTGRDDPRRRLAMVAAVAQWMGDPFSPFADEQEAAAAELVRAGVMTVDDAQAAVDRYGSEPTAAQIDAVLARALARAVMDGHAVPSLQSTLSPAVSAVADMAHRVTTMAKKKTSKKKASKKKATKKAPAKKKASKKKAAKKAPAKKKASKKKATGKGGRKASGSRTVVETRTRKSKGRGGCTTTTTTKKRTKCPLAGLLGAIELPGDLAGATEDRMVNEVAREAMGKGIEAFELAATNPQLRKMFGFKGDEPFEVRIEGGKDVGIVNAMTPPGQPDVVVARFSSPEAARDALKDLGFKYRKKGKVWRYQLPSILKDRSTGNLQRDIDFRTGNKQTRLFGESVGTAPAAAPAKRTVELSKADLRDVMKRRNEALDRVKDLAPSAAVKSLLDDARRHMLAARGAFDTGRDKDGHDNVKTATALMTALAKRSPNAKAVREMQSGTLDGISNVGIEARKAG